VKKEIRKVLIVRLSSIGDIVILTPIFRSIKEKFPYARIHYLIKKEFYPIVQDNPYVDRFWLYDVREGFRGWVRICRELASEDYDLLIDMHNVLRTWILSLILFKAIQLRYYKPRLFRFLLFYFYINLFPPDYSLLKEYYNVLKPLGINYNGQKPEIFLNEKIVDKAKNELRNIGLNGPFATILPIANWKNKRYSLEKYAILAERITREYNLSVLWLGGKNDIYLKELPIRDKNSNYLYLSQDMALSLGILSLSNLVIGNDTGLTYAAEAIGVPTILILGPTSCETGAGLYTDHGITIEKRLWCRPCSQRGNRKCYRKKQYCLEIEPDEIFKSVKKLIKM